MKKIIFITALILSFTIITHAHAEERYALRYFGTNLNGAYELAPAFSIFSGMVCLYDANNTANCNLPEQSLLGGLNIELSFPISKRWAIRPVLGYQYTAWNKATAANLSTWYKHSVAFDLLFDVYLEPGHGWHPYVGFGPGTRRYLEFMPVIAFGGHLELVGNMSLKMELKVGSLLLWTFVEPTVGLNWVF